MKKQFLLILVMLPLLLPAEAARKMASSTKEKEDNVSVTPLSDKDKQLFDYFFQEAVNLKHQEKYAEAYELYRYCTVIDSLNPQPWYELSSFYRSLNLADQALGTLEKAYRLDSGNEWYTFALANMYLSLNRVQDAIFLYENLVQTRPDDENLLYQLAGLYTRTKDFKASIRILNLVERLIGKNEGVSLEKYKIYKQTGNPRKAIREIESLRQEYPYDVDYVLLLGDAWMDLGKPEKSYLVYLEAKTMDPGNPSIALSLADYYNVIGDSVAASNQLHLALTNPDTDIETKLNILTPMLVTSMQGGDSLRILSYFDLLLEQHPNEYQIRELYVQWLLEKGNKQQAKDELRTVLDLNPNQLKAWKNYLELNLEYDNQPFIRSVCQEALTYFPKEALFWFYLGLTWTSEQEGGKNDLVKSQEAINAFQKAIEAANSEDKGFISRLYGITGDTYLLLNDTIKAFDLYEKALSAYSGNLLVLNNYAYYLAVGGKDLSKAEKMSRKTIEADPKNATFLDTFAWVFFKQGQFSLAKIYIERAISNEPDPNAEVLEHYGDILWFNQEPDAARQQWEKAAQVENPSDTLLRKVETGIYCIEETNPIE